MPAPRPTPAHPSDIPQWVEQLADTLALITTAFFIMQAGSWPGKDNWIVAIAMGAAAWFLIGNYNGPVRSWLRAIFTELLLTIVTLVESIGQFLEAASRYYGGNFARMVIAIILVPLALGVFRDLMGYAGVRDLLTFVTYLIDGVRRFAQEATDFVRDRIEDLRVLLTGQLHDLLAFIPQELDRFRSLIEGDFNRLFTTAERRLDRLEASIDTTAHAIVSFVNSATAALHLRIDLLGVRLDLMPEFVRGFLTDQLLARFDATIAALPPEPTEPGPVPPPAIAEALARVLADIRRAEAGEAVPQAQAAAAVVEGIHALTVT